MIALLFICVNTGVGLVFLHIKAVTCFILVTALLIKAFSKAFSKKKTTILSILLRKRRNNTMVLEKNDCPAVGMCVDRCSTCFSAQQGCHSFASGGCSIYRKDFKKLFLNKENNPIYFVKKMKEE